MKRPYKLGLLTMVGITISSLVLCTLNFPDWITSTATSMAGIIYVLYLASKDGPITGIEDLDVKTLYVLLWLTLVLTYPKVIYEMWKDREIIRAKIRGE